MVLAKLSYSSISTYSGMPCFAVYLSRSFSLPSIPGWGRMRSITGCGNRSSLSSSALPRGVPAAHGHLPELRPSRAQPATRRRTRPIACAGDQSRVAQAAHAGTGEVAPVPFDEVRAGGPPVGTGQTAHRQQQQARIGYEQVACVLLGAETDRRVVRAGRSHLPVAHPSSSIPPAPDNPWQLRAPPAGPPLPCHAPLRGGSASRPADPAWLHASTSLLHPPRSARLRGCCRRCCGSGVEASRRPSRM